MTLGEKQRLFTKLVGQLIAWSYQNGFELTFGDAYRSPEQAALNAAKQSGIASSLHTQRLAIDLNLFIDGAYQSASEAYKPLGDYWKSLDPGCCWGGDFVTRSDGNHFSITHDGVK
jgi:D-alanyl-D-alanine carboxypeptidase-like protein